MNNPLVSVVIAAYNCEKYIIRCLESISSQTYPNIEIIICDDCSTDGTFEKISNYKTNRSIIVLKNDKNMNQAFTRNRCISKASGKYIAIQDGDDVSAPNRIEKLVNIIETNDNISFVSSGFYLFDDNGTYKYCDKNKKYPQKKDFLYGLPFCHAATLFLKSTLEKVNCYTVSKTTIRGEDYDLFFKLYAQGFIGCNESDCLYGYMVDKKTIRRRKLKYRLHECIIRYRGYRKFHILFPIGWIYVFKPILAFIVQFFRFRR